MEGCIFSASNSIESEHMTKEILDVTGFGLPRFPLFVVRPLLSHLITSLVKRHPNLFDRLGDYGSKRFLIDPVDLPFTMLLCPDSRQPELTPHSRETPPEHDAAILGPLGKFIDLVNGEEDGDALFFSRDLQIEGDTEAVLALRNAIDDMEIDLVEEIDELLGPLAGAARFARQRAGDAEVLFSDLKMVFSETFVRKTIDRSRGHQISREDGV
jgi:predicted lipid carrier protein YhbT